MDYKSSMASVMVTPSRIIKEAQEMENQNYHQRILSPPKSEISQQTHNSCSKVFPLGEHSVNITTPLRFQSAHSHASDLPILSSFSPPRGPPSTSSMSETGVPGNQHDTQYYDAIGSHDSLPNPPQAQHEAIFEYRHISRSRRETNVAAEPVWPDDLEEAFMEALRSIPKLGRRKLTVNGKPSGRNELIADYIYRKTGKRRTRKQVSSHIQVLKHVKYDDPDFMRLVTDDQTMRRTQSQLSHVSTGMAAQYPAHQDYLMPTNLNLSSDMGMPQVTSQWDQDVKQDYFSTPSRSIRPKNMPYGRQEPYPTPTSSTFFHSPAPTQVIPHSSPLSHTQQYGVSSLEAFHPAQANSGWASAPPFRSHFDDNDTAGNTLANLQGQISHNDE